jgi:DNA-directed RNA polymerase sigma subunit (sigma70/sigma32)
LEGLTLISRKRTYEDWRFHGHYCNVQPETYTEDALGILVPDGAGDADPLETACREEVLARLGRALEELPERERRVLGMRYGLDGGEVATLDAVGAALGMSRQGAQNLQARAEERVSSTLALCGRKG